MVSSTPLLPAGEDLPREAARPFAGELLLCALVRDGLKLSTAEIVAIAHALGEVAITDSDGAFAASLETVSIDAAGRVRRRGRSSASGPPVAAIKRELERLSPLVASPLGLRRVLSIQVDGTEAYLDRLAAVSDVSPGEVLGALARRLLRRRGQDSGAPSPNEPTRIGPRTHMRAATSLKFVRHSARHGDQFSPAWALEQMPTWRSRRSHIEEMSFAPWGWGRPKRVLVFAGEAMPDTPQSAVAAPAVSDGLSSAIPEAPVFSASEREMRLAVRARSARLARARVPRVGSVGRVALLSWYRVSAAVDGVRRVLSRCVRRQAPSGAS